MSKKTVAVKVDDFCGRPRIEYNYAARPSWRRYGEGLTCVSITKEHDGSLYVIASENPDEGRGGKEVFFSIPTVALAEVKKLDAEHNALVAVADAAKALKETIGASVGGRADYSQWVVLQTALAGLDTIRRLNGGGK